ncbi:SgcJ/EcaC family oxidoreductase (plasmid) [Pseudomonas luteola]|uniref:YybH family protein n=1 Tax=Pseudomonas luteola TaxID=47886 RepID=UPI003890CD70
MSQASLHIKQLIEAADRAITAENFDALMDFYADDATLVIKPGLQAKGKEQIRRAFVAIAEYFNHSLTVTQGEMEIIEGADVALVVMETHLESKDKNDVVTNISRRATYVFRKYLDNTWLCTIDNSYGTDLIGTKADV